MESVSELDWSSSSASACYYRGVYCKATVASCAITLESQLYYKGSQYALYASIILGYGYMCGVIQGKPKFLDINWSVLDISHIKWPVFTVARVCTKAYIIMIMIYDRVCTI